MAENPSSDDWASARGEKWLAQLAGMEAMLAPVDEPLIRVLRLEAPLRIADVACGGGGTTLTIAQRAPQGSAVHGFDISPALIEHARTRVDPDADPISFACRNVATEPPPEPPYARLSSRFGVMFFDDPAAAFGNLTRWLAPRGRFAFAVWGHPAENPWASSLRQTLAEVIDLPHPDPEAPGPFRYAGADRLLELLDAAGFVELEVEDWRGALAIGGGLPASQAAELALAAFGVAEHLADADDAAREDVRRRLTARYTQHLRDGAVYLDAHVHLCTGARPGPA